MRKVAHAVIYFNSEGTSKVLSMMKDYCSALRCAYQGIHQKGIVGNDLKKHVKVKYSQYLNATWVADACLQAGMINQEHSVFGGKLNWQHLQTGAITKEQWLLRRNNQLYARGERSRQGNRQVRFSEDLSKVYINSPEGRNKWVEGKMYIPKKFKDTVDLSCYCARVMYREETDTFELNIEYDVSNPDTVIFSTLEGVLGIDTNPDLLAVVETDRCGNLKSHRSLKSERILYARSNKRDVDINLLAKEVVNRALELSKPIVLEDLRFTQESKRKGSKKFKRLKSNFAYSKLVSAIEVRAIKNGVGVIKVNPAFTSKLGALKYKAMYNISVHTSAALCIGRRGQGIERERKTYKESQQVKDVKGKQEVRWNLEGRSHTESLTEKAQSWLRSSFIRESRLHIENRTSQVSILELGQPKH